MAEFTDTKVVELIDQLEELLPSMGMPEMTAMDFFTQQEKLGIVLLPREFHYEGDTFDDSFVFAGPCLGDRSFQGGWSPSSGDDPVLLISLGTVATLVMAAPWGVSDELWSRIEPLLPVRPASRTGRSRCRIGRCGKGSCSCWSPESDGRTCRRNWGPAPGWSAGADSPSK